MKTLKHTLWAIVVLSAVAACLVAGLGCTGDYQPPADRLPWDTDADGAPDVVVVDADGDGVPDADPITGRLVIDRAETERLLASRQSDTWEQIAVSVLGLAGLVAGYPVAGVTARYAIRTWRANRNTERVAQRSRQVIEDVVSTVQAGKTKLRAALDEAQQALGSGDPEQASRLIDRAQELFETALEAQAPDTQEAVAETKRRLPNVLDAPTD